MSDAGQHLHSNRLALVEAPEGAAVGADGQQSPQLQPGDGHTLRANTGSQRIPQHSSSKSPGPQAVLHACLVQQAKARPAAGRMGVQSGSPARSPRERSWRRAAHASGRRCARSSSGRCRPAPPPCRGRRRGWCIRPSPLSQACAMIARVWDLHSSFQKDAQYSAEAPHPVHIRRKRCTKS